MMHIKSEIWLLLQLSCKGWGRFDISLWVEFLSWSWQNRRARNKTCLIVANSLNVFEVFTHVSLLFSQRNTKWWFKLRWTDTDLTQAPYTVVSVSASVYVEYCCFFFPHFFFVYFKRQDWTWVDLVSAPTPTRSTSFCVHFCTGSIRSHQHIDADPTS